MLKAAHNGQVQGAGNPRAHLQTQTRKVDSHGGAVSLAEQAKFIQQFSNMSSTTSNAVRDSTGENQSTLKKSSASQGQVAGNLSASKMESLNG